jgi:hypothetical protein
MHRIAGIFFSLKPCPGAAQGVAFASKAGATK